MYSDFHFKGSIVNEIVDYKIVGLMYCNGVLIKYLGDLTLDRD